MAHPAFDAVAVSAYVGNDGHAFAAADIADPLLAAEVAGRFEVRREANLLQVLFVSIVVVLPQVILVPLEQLQQDQAPALVQVYD